MQAVDKRLSSENTTLKNDVSGLEKKLNYFETTHTKARENLEAIPLLADFSYDQTSQITGGAMLRVMHMAGAYARTCTASVFGWLVLSAQKDGQYL